MAHVDHSRSVQKAERDVLLYRILSGKVEYRDTYIKEPNYKIQGIGARIYRDVLKDCKDVLSDRDVYVFLLETDQFTIQAQKKLESLPKEMEQTKVLYYQNFRNPVYRKQYKYEIEIKKELYRDLAIKRNKYKNLTPEGIASGAMWFEMINYMYKGSDKLAAINFYHSNKIGDHSIRDIVLDDLWISYYSSTKNIFGKSAIHLTEDQRSLLSWSKIYQNIRSGTEPPHEDIIKDHDALDGWFILQSRKKKAESKTDGSKGVLPNAKNVFYTVKTEDEFNEIMALNTPEALAEMKKELRLE